MNIHLGYQGAHREPVELPVAALLRHVVALGSSGSGKTVLCKVVVEEAVRHGIPVICVDPQGDLSSLALAGERAGEPVDERVDEPVDEMAAREFGARADVVVFTPASRRGVPLCADPLAGLAPGLAPDERVHARTRAADMIASLLGYDADSDDGAGLRAVVDTALGDMDERGQPAHRLADLTDYLTQLDDARAARYEILLDKRKLRTACQRLARLDVGARRLLFHDGLGIDIDMLLGRDEDERALAGKTRISVIYLNTLHSTEDKEFFIATLVERLYTWMLGHPSARPQALFYIDEIAPFLPPVRKPACKPGLALLFKQARKYGISCLMATQNPGDVDYKAMSQFGTWALGRLSMRQDIDKVASAIKSLAPMDADRILSQLPAQRPGQFQLIAPDHLGQVCQLESRWLYSAHRTLDEERIEELADERWRQRFAVARDAPPTRARRGARMETTPETPPETPPEAKAKTKTKTKTEAKAKTEAKTNKASPAVAQAHAADEELERMARILETLESANAREFAEAAGIGQGKARRVLRDLVDGERARTYRAGRSTRFFARGSGARPDLGLGQTIAIVQPELDENRARGMAESVRRSSFLGLLGEDEDLDSATLVFRPVYQVVFEETLVRTGIERLLGPREEQLVGTVYQHANTLHVLRFTRKEGIAFVEQPGGHASRVDDFDGAARFADVAPGSIAIDEEMWRARRSEKDVRASFRKWFEARPERVTPYFVPIWRLMFRQRTSGNYRVVLLDGIVGKPVDWPGAP